MNDFGFPIYNTNKQKGNRGSSYMNHFITNDLKWVYRHVNEESDFGIDAYVEIVDEGKATGKLIGIQVKHGESYFSSSTISGFKYYGERKHLNYYLNSNSPIIIVILSEEFHLKKWVLFELSATEETESGWSIEIPLKNDLTINSCHSWIQYCSPIIDYKNEIEHNWALSKKINESDLITIAIPKFEIENGTYDYVQDIFKKITKNNEIILRSQSKLNFVFPDYDNDPREIWEITEIRKWILETFNNNLPWMYFSEINADFSFFSLFLYCYLTERGIECKNGHFNINRSHDYMKDFFYTIFHNLNQFAEENRISSEIVKKITESVNEFFNGPVIEKE